MNIVTKFVMPHIGTRKWDWMAYVKGDEEGNLPTGRGETEIDALRDLCEQLLEIQEKEA